ncbi:MAG: ATP-binding protein [Thermoleophilia bacterium]
MAGNYIRRLLQVPNRSFFLFGPRGVGKSTWLRNNLPGSRYFDLLDTSLFLELTRSPGTIEALAGDLAPGSWIVIDEVQKSTQLLEEVHRLMEKRKWRFALCGSSARKLRRGGVNLLGGRAVTRELRQFCSKELGASFDLEQSLQWGLLPMVLEDWESAGDILDSYVHTYIRQEIQEEGLVRKLAPFARFLSIAGQLNGQVINAQNISRDAAVPRSTVDVYFSILFDTLLGDFLPAYRPQAKVREAVHPKFYWFDPGVARASAGLLNDPADRLWLGAALETLILHELKVYNHVNSLNRDISFYRSGTSEIDFVIETRKRRSGSKASIICAEVKLADKWDRKWEKPMRSLADQGKVKVEKMFGVYTGKRSYTYEGLEVLPVTRFLERLYAGKIF